MAAAVPARARQFRDGPGGGARRGQGGRSGRRGGGRQEEAHVGQPRRRRAGGAIARRTGRWAENGLAAVLIGVIGAIVSARDRTTRSSPSLFGLLAVVGCGAVLLFHESGIVMRRRLAAAVEAAALATGRRATSAAARDTAQVLLGPWSTVIHD